MMRLADYLIRWTGDVAYADYWERNLYNGILAQQHPDTGMIAYWLPLHGGGIKAWGTPTETFWCCHGTLVEAHAVHSRGIYYEDAGGLVISQYVPSTVRWTRGETPVTVTQDANTQRGTTRRPHSLACTITVAADRPLESTLTLRLPWWVQGEPSITVNGVPETGPFRPSSFYGLRRMWHNDTLSVVLPTALTAAPLPDAPDTVAFMDGPVVLAGLCDEERTLIGSARQPETMLTPDNEREWGDWLPGYRTRGQLRNFRLVPLYEVRDERYTVYFPVRGAE
jgi:DUF1680 family protein